MRTTTTTDRRLWRQVLRGDALMQEYFAAPTDLGGARLLCCDRADEFNLALVDDVPAAEADAALAAIVRHCRARGATPRVRLTPFSAPDWPTRLAAAGFVETDERRRFWLVPNAVRLAAHPEIVVGRVTTPAEADEFSAIQAAGFGFPPEHEGWDRRLARRGLATGSVWYYLGRVGGRAVGAGAVVPLTNGAVGLWGLATLPAARQAGVGTAVFRRMIEDARSAGDGPVFFTTARDNPIGAVYERLGCRPLFTTSTFAPAR